MSSPLSPKHPEESSSDLMLNRFLIQRMSLALVGIILFAIFGSFSVRAVTRSSQVDQSKAQEQPPIPGTVATATPKTVPVRLQAIGNLESHNSVAVTPKVKSLVQPEHLSLDDRSEQAALQQAQETLTQDLAQVQQARAAFIKDLMQVRQAQAALAKDQAQDAQSQNSCDGERHQPGAVCANQAQPYSASSQSGAATVEADQEAIATAQAALDVDQATLQNAQEAVNADQGALRNAEVQLSSRSSPSI
ncbi:MAG TPA: hypothetical protein V6C57_19490 [Coleofasciculaceae cyanobacterium]